ncbi:MAG: aminomethyl-transferring glycine dehydrogenase subunit GcvPA [Chromatiales bacterium]|nr:MAG: aminomethyl-transferring glycine dehydrogenase subunit GcvPA [Chromatiales bacterium]
MPFIPHTDDEVRDMLGVIGAGSIDELFDEIPAALRIDGLDGMLPAINEAGVKRLMTTRAAADTGSVCFIGAGAYDHYVPAAVWAVASRGEFYSAYTPYQAEASQGTLQVIYEYQSMMAELTGLDVSNASLYDGATAFAEACLMAVRANRKSKSNRILTTRGMSPAYRAAAKALLRGQGLELVELPLSNGVTDLQAMEWLADQDFAALAIQQPGFLGTLEAADALTDFAHANNMLVIGVCNITSLALLKPPGQWGETGADIACGEGQPLGIPLSSGGPYFGYMVCRQSLVRQMPGRIAGRTVDLDGKPGFTLTLQAREQHIRRAKATSNICTNQGLMVTAATIYMALLGGDGLRRVALQSHANTRVLVDGLIALDGVSVAFADYFHEAVIVLDRPVAPVLAALTRQGVLGGYDLSADYPELGHALLVCATEQRTPADIDNYVRSLRDALAGSRAA